jgi:mannose-6-phosphate isomerase-like protein (cupin superfamily)
MQAFSLPDVEQQRRAAGRPYLEFLRVPSLSLGIYELAAGGVDRQQPHTEDEVYFVTAGRAMVTVADEERAVGPGSMIYVAASVPHRFHSITEDLRLLVFFAPAEYSQAAV